MRSEVSPVIYSIEKILTKGKFIHLIQFFIHSIKVF